MKEIRVYTRTGDKGTTSLASGTRVPKYHLRLEAYGSLDELNSHIGALVVQDKTARKLILKIQNRIFTICSGLALDSKEMAAHLPKIKETDIEELETDMDRMLDILPELKSFILPGGHPVPAQCHIARTVCRRAERLIVKLAEEIEIEENNIKYVNRLSDYLFVLARKISYDQGTEELKWSPDYEERGM